ARRVEAGRRGDRDGGASRGRDGLHPPSALQALEARSRFEVTSPPGTSHQEAKGGPVRPYVGKPRNMRTQTKPRTRTRRSGVSLGRRRPISSGAFLFLFELLELGEHRRSSWRPHTSS